MKAFKTKIIREPRYTREVSEQQRIMRAEAELRALAKAFPHGLKSSPARGIKEDLDSSLKNYRRAARQPVVGYQVRLERPLARGYGNVSTGFYQVPSVFCDVDTLKIMRDDLRNRVRDFRERLKRVRTRDKYFGNVAYQTVGGIFQHPGSILELAKGFKRTKVTREKKPKTIVRHVGIELEILSPATRPAVIDAFLDAGLENYVCVKDDGSLRPNPGDFGHEICILSPETEVHSIVARVATVLKALNVYVNQSCGMHVHLDMRDRDHRVSFSNLVASQRWLYAMVPAARKENTYCRPTHGRTFKYTGSRYRGVNADSMQRHGTIEVRIHSGTANAGKISAWVQLLIGIANAPEFPRAPQTLTNLRKLTGMSDSLYEYCKLRIEKFGSPERQSENEESQASA